MSSSTGSWPCLGETRRATPGKSGEVRGTPGDGETQYAPAHFPPKINKDPFGFDRQMTQNHAIDTSVLAPPPDAYPQKQRSNIWNPTVPVAPELILPDLCTQFAHCESGLESESHIARKT